MPVLTQPAVYCQGVAVEPGTGSFRSSRWGLGVAIAGPDTTGGPPRATGEDEEGGNVRGGGARVACCGTGSLNRTVTREWSPAVTVSRLRNGECPDLSTVSWCGPGSRTILVDAPY